MLVGTIANTDYGWYELLSKNGCRDEVNFWTPTASQTFRAPEFSPFLFRLKAPNNAIAGFGLFARYTVLPDWLAWDCFGEANGCASLAELQSRTLRLRTGGNVGAGSSAQIGCIVLTSPVFFKPLEWIRQPDNWSPHIQRYKRYDLEQGEGRRVWAECRERLTASELPGTGAVHDPTAIYGTPTLVRPRLGQGTFRVIVTEAYRRACAVTGEHSLPALEAAHIRPVSHEGAHDVRNGLLLRADLHRLFDQGYVTVGSDLKLEVSSRLRDDYQNGRSYYPLHGFPIAVPANPREHPEPDLLRWHNENVYRG